jgi:hypothetical protein
MRLPIVITAGLLAFLSMNAPVMSQFTTKDIKPSVTAANSNIKQYRTNYRLWNRQKISNYRYTLSRSCFCIPDARGPVVVEVRNGKTVSVKLVETGKPVNPELFQKYDTVPKLFELIRNAIAKKVSRLDVEYNPQLGYPTKVNIDYNSQIADEEEYITVENLQEIK